LNVRFDFHQWLDRTKNLDLRDLVATANESAGAAERELRSTKRGKEAREGGAKRYVEQLGQLLYFLRHQQRADGTIDIDWLAYRPTIERLVIKGDLPPEVLEQFPKRH
jgi:hypothetical protein